MTDRATVAAGAQRQGQLSHSPQGAVAVTPCLGQHWARKIVGWAVTMRPLRAWAFVLIAAAVSGFAVEALAQPVYLDPQRDCQTLRNCNFRRGGAFRGC